VKERINEGGPPTTREWNEHEARQEQLPGADRLFVYLGKGTPHALPELTPEQIAGRADRLEKALRMCMEALAREPWDERWTNRLMQAHDYGRKVITEASTWTQPEEHSGTPLPEDAAIISAVGRQAEGGE
jgi:hypothetical protein